MKRYAFTLIELLVVIAIIAILAAILFPVFAQAKQAAKKTASLSNIKQQALACIMYEGDADDHFVLYVNGSYGNLYNPNIRTDTWVWLLQPYTKNLGLDVDPGVGDTQNEFGGGVNSWYANQDSHPQYGYNYLFLSPFWNCDTSLSRSASLAVKPSDTVMFTTSMGFVDAPLVGFNAVNAPGAWPIVAPAPHACIWYSAVGFYTGNWSANNPPNIGKVTASVRIKTYSDGALVAWVDGHAKYMRDGALAVGTDYSTATYTNANVGAQILDTNAYKWTLDGTLTDLGL